MPDAEYSLSEYVKRVMKLKRLTPEDVQRMSGGRITDLAHITAEKATNLSVETLVVLANSLGVDVDELFHVARGLPEDDRMVGYTIESLKILETVQKAAASPDVIEILGEAVRMSPEQRRRLLDLLKELGIAQTKTCRTVELDAPKSRLSYEQVISNIRKRQRARGHHPRTREQVDAYVREERDSWGE